MPNATKLLTVEQSRLIQLLIAGKNQQEAATELGIHPKTAQRWLALPHVAEAYQVIKQDVAAQVREQIKALAGKAIKALDESLSSRAPMVKLKASELVLNRVAPAEIAEAKAGQEGSMVDRALLPYLTDEELVTIENIVRLAEERRAETEEQKITPMRRTG